MKTTMRKYVRLCAAGALMVLATCSPDALLQVDNPSQIQLDKLDDIKLMDVQVAGVQDQFLGTYVGTIIQYANYPTDEMITGLNWEDYARANQRIVSYLEGPTNGIFEGLSKPLRMGNDVAERIRGWITEYPERELRDELALTLNMAGYSALVMAENMCQSVISPDPDDPSGTVLSQLEVFEVAIPYLEEALTAAQAVGNSDLANLARTGLARAHLGMGHWAEAGQIPQRQASLIVDPPNGRLPPLTAAGREKSATMRSSSEGLHFARQRCLYDSSPRRKSIRRNPRSIAALKVQSVAICPGDTSAAAGSIPPW